MEEEKNDVMHISEVEGSKIIESSKDEILSEKEKRHLENMKLLQEQEKQKKKEREFQYMIKNLEKRVHHLRLVSELKDLEDKLNDKVKIEDGLRRDTIIVTMKELNYNDREILEYLKKHELLNDEDKVLLSEMEKKEKEEKEKEEVILIKTNKDNEESQITNEDVKTHSGVGTIPTCCSPISEEDKK